MAPDDTRNIFYNTSKSSVEELPILPVVFPHHLLMVAVASTASKLSTVKSCTQEEMDSSKLKDLNNSQQNISSSSYSAEPPSNEEEEDDSEIRQIIEMTCNVDVDENSSETKLSLLLRFEDKMNRQLTCSVSEDETGLDLANELVEYGLISEVDRDKVADKINEHLEDLG